VKALNPQRSECKELEFVDSAKRYAGEGVKPDFKNLAPNMKDHETARSNPSRGCRRKRSNELRREEDLHSASRIRRP
jgi:hypothetical protein